MENKVKQWIAEETDSCSSPCDPRYSNDLLTVPIVAVTYIIIGIVQSHWQSVYFQTLHIFYSTRYVP